MKSEQEGSEAPEETEMLPEYDFESGLVQQGRSYRRVKELRTKRHLKPELVDEFPDDDSVNAALEEYLRIKRKSA